MKSWIIFGIGQNIIPLWARLFYFIVFIVSWFDQFSLHVKIKQKFWRKNCLGCYKNQIIFRTCCHILLLSPLSCLVSVWLLLENVALSGSHEVIIQPNKIWFLFNGYLRTSFSSNSDVLIPVQNRKLVLSINNYTESDLNHHYCEHLLLQLNLFV